MSDSVKIVIRGKTSFAKLLGDPMYNKFSEDNEWKMDLVLDKPTAKEMAKYGIADKVKTKDDYLDGQPYLSFKVKEFRANGKRNDPPKVKDILDNPWDQSKLIGNGSVVNVKADIVDYGPGKKKGLYLRSVQVLDLVSYEPKDFAAIAEDDEFYEAAKAAQAELDAKVAEAPSTNHDLEDDPVV